MTENDPFVAVFMGSIKDRDHIDGMIETLDDFDIDYDVRALSAHKIPRVVLDEVEEYNAMDRPVVYIVVAGKSNALGPVIAANADRPVINCPVIGSYNEDLFSSLRMPTAVPCSTVLKPQNAALHAVKLFSLSDPDLREEYNAYVDDIKQQIVADDEQLEV